MTETEGRVGTDESPAPRPPRSTTTPSPSWTGDVWIHDRWTEEDRSLARDRLLDASASSSSAAAAPPSSSPPWHQQRRREGRRQGGGDTDDRHGDPSSRPGRERERAFREFRRNASTNWNAFYNRNGTNFFKDRHYLHKAFPEEFAWLYDGGSPRPENGTTRVVDDGDDGAAATSDATGGPPRDGGGGDVEAADDGRGDVRVVEIGCGVGNAVLPLLERHSELMRRYREGENATTDAPRPRRPPPPRLHVHCLDFAPSAIELLKEDPRFASAAGEGRATAHVCDLSSAHPATIFIGNSDGTPHRITSHEAPRATLANSADVAILLFCLSAVGPHPSPSLDRAARHVIDTLRPGGTLVMRDYGRLDEAQMKLGDARDRELGDNFYRKGDGTGCYYFELDDLRDLFVNEHARDDKLEELELDYVTRVYRNRGDGTTRRRVWVQGRFRKPPRRSAPRAEERVTSIGGGPNASGDALQQYLNTAIERWDEHYKALSPASPGPSLPSNLLQMFPDEFRPWQPVKRKGKRCGPNRQALQSQTDPSGLTVVDLGCGLGNDTLLNLLERQRSRRENDQQESASHGPSKPPVLNVHFVDASDVAIEKLRDDPRYRRAMASDGDATEPEAPAAAVTSRARDLASADDAAAADLEGSADVVLLLFALSAVGPYCPQRETPRYSGVTNAVRNAARMLRPGGVALFRDFARYDDDQLQLNSVVGARLCDNFYVRRSDDDSTTDCEGGNESSATTGGGTGCHFFALEEVKQLFTNVGLEVLQLEYVTRIHKKKGKNGRECGKNGGAVERTRIWVHGRFRKPSV